MKTYSGEVVRVFKCGLVALSMVERGTSREEEAAPIVNKGFPGPGARSFDREAA